METRNYQPSKEILEKYADVLVNFALNSGKGVKKGEVVLLEVPECAKPLLLALQKAVLKAGANHLTNYLPNETAKQFYELAETHQLKFFPDKFLKGKVEQSDHAVYILSETDKKELEGIDAKKILARSLAFKPYKEWREEKENSGKFTWTMALYGTEEMAKEAGMTLEEYWKQIIRSCFLNEEKPLEKWKNIFDETEEIKNKLNKLKIETIKVVGKNINLNVGIGKNRQWMGGSGRNIPSFELFISPDFRKTEGKISFDQPVYRYGNLISGISLEFKEGKVINFSAQKGEQMLKEMIETDKGSCFVGEFSLTDIRFSKIDRFMAETLYDENFGGKFGNMHIALGSAYKDSYPNAEEISKIPKEKWKEMGYNDSVVHTDIVNSEEKSVYVVLEDGKEILIYKNGEFLV